MLVLVKIADLRALLALMEKVDTMEVVDMGEIKFLKAIIVDRQVILGKGFQLISILTINNYK